jgi:multidrug resistance efflux pump
MQAGAAFNPVERQKRIKLDQLNLNVDKALAQLRAVKQQVAEANAELQQAHSELGTMHASTVQAVQEVRDTGASLAQLRTLDSLLVYARMI